ncbi:hypothetical protein Ciccas_001855 [Cichlidogyrus casuarinus]|uniref:EF-hand domain-containing protein n=1 Tax=Cichlidogyrus casuarinus TaxID=1844966 RepID=A0ABD2QIW7_9PLAT
MGQKQTRIKADVVEYLLENTHFTYSEIISWHTNFLKDCPSGIITITDFERIFVNFFPYGDVDLFAKSLFNLFDLNHDNVIDFQEFMIALNITSKGSYQEKLEWAFNMYDKDKDGFISKQDMISVITAIYQMIGNIIKLPDDELKPEQRVAKIFAAMDRDSDAKLDLKEFMLGVQNDPLICNMLNASPDAIISAMQPMPKIPHNLHSSNSSCDFGPAKRKASRSRHSSQEFAHPDPTKRHDRQITANPIHHKQSSSVVYRRIATASSDSLGFNP